MDLNFHGSRRITNAVLPSMLTRKSGSIVYISSIAGKEAIGAPIHYGVAKAALIAYVKSLARTLGSSNIRANVVCPGNIYFEGGTWDLKLKENENAVTQMLKDRVPLNRFARPEEIANLVVFLASERASFITGSCVVADGGQTLSV
jgi:3-oxoacyl-[acyl-carrier protein] reductase